jgi:hypothetical protein
MVVEGSWDLVSIKQADMTLYVKVQYVLFSSEVTHLLPLCLFSLPMQDSCFASISSAIFRPVVVLGRP